MNIQIKNCGQTIKICICIIFIRYLEERDLDINCTSICFRKNYSVHVL